MYSLQLLCPRNPPLLPLPPSLFSSIPICRHCCRFPCPCQIKSRLFPPPHPHLRPRRPFQSPTQVQQWSCSDVLCDRFLAPPDVVLNFQEPRLLPCCCRQGVRPLTVRFVRGSLPVSRLATCYWTPPRAFPMCEVNTQVSNLKISTACTTGLKNKPDTHCASPSLLRIRVILFHTSLARDKFVTTSGKFLSAAKISRPRFLKEVTISRGRP